MQSRTKRFAHNCRDCRQRYNVLIQIDLRQVHQAICPHCGAKNFFDNRDGRLAGKPRKKSAGARRPAVPAPARQSAGAASSQTAAGFAPRETSLRDFRDLPRKPAEPAARASSQTDYANYTDNGDARQSREGGERRVLRNGSGFRWLSPLEWPAAIGRWWDRRGAYAVNDLLDAAQGRWGVLIVLGAVCAMVAIGAAWLSLQFPKLYLAEAPAAYIKRIDVLEPNLVLDRNGTLIAELFSERSGELTVDSLPPELAATLVFTEDQNFYDHGGVHWPSIFRAFLVNLFSGGYSQGGSTITQQLSRILLNDRTKSIVRKLRETALAYELEHRLTKQQILVGYMNHVYLGHGSRGFEPAARFYFEKDIAELSFSERLALVCLPSAPNRYSPLRNPDQLRRKMDAVYTRLRNGDGDLTAIGPLPEPVAYHREATQMLRSLDKSPGESVFGTRVNEAPYVSEYVRQKLVQLLGKSYQYGQGLRIQTTIDAKLQRAADRESHEFVRQKAPGFPPRKMKDGKVIWSGGMREKLLRAYGEMAIGPELFSIPAPRRITAQLQTASIGIETRTGRVLFMQGGADFTSGNQLNRAIQMRRQTGSAIKPFVYSAGIESGAITAGTLLDDRPIYVSLKGQPRQPNKKDYWLPGNYSGVFEGEILVRRALERSQNIPAIQVAREVGIQRLGQQFRKFFFFKNAEYQRRFRQDDTVAIGSLEMSPLEVATAFTAFGNNGTIKRPYLIRRIQSATGEELWSAGASYDEFDLGVPAERKVLPGDAAEVMVSLLRSSAKFGGVGKGGFSSPQLIGKTGTSNEYRDAWFVGSIPDVTAVVWMGFDQPAFSMPGGTGAGLAGPLWGRIMKSAPASKGTYQFTPRAKKIEICKTTGRRPAAGCPRRVREYFTRSHPPEEASDADRRGLMDSPNNARRPADSPARPNDSTDSSSDFSVNSDSDFD